MTEDEIEELDKKVKHFMSMYEDQRKELIAIKVILRKIDGYDFRFPDK
jgi:hypothetical protein